VELRRDPRGEEKRSLKLMRKRPTVAEPGGGGGGGGGAARRRSSSGAGTDVRRRLDQLSYDNQQFRELLAKVSRRATIRCDTTRDANFNVLLYRLLPTNGNRIVIIHRLCDVT